MAERNALAVLWLDLFITGRGDHISVCTYVRLCLLAQSRAALLCVDLRSGRVAAIVRVQC